MTTNEIVDSIYKAYGTDSGILFGIKERDITKAIVEFTINRLSDERKALLDALEDAREVMLHFKDAPDWDDEKENTYKKVSSLLK